MRRVVRVWVLGAVFGLGAVAGAGTNTITITADAQLALGDAFFAEGEYYRAVTEYMRFVHLFGGSKRVPYALLRVGLARYEGGEYAGAIEYFARTRQTYHPDSFGAAAFHEALCFERLEKPGQAQDAFERVLAFDAGDAHAPRALVGKALGCVLAGDMAGARRELERAGSLFDAGTVHGRMRDAIRQLDGYRGASRRSPSAAACLAAVVPGSGHCYAGRQRDGVVAFLVNGLFIAGTVVALEQENYPSAAVIGAFGAPFYLGNIYGAANAAHRWNVALRHTLRDELALTLGYAY
jgi:tetratricopeptide (TPR) repeat protein